MTICKAKRYSDQMICDTCGLQWDINDQDRPPCNPVVVEPKRNRFNKLRKKLGFSVKNN